MKKLEKKLSISEQTTTGGAVIGTGGHVDLALGMFDRPGPSGKKNDKFTYSDFTVPVLPSEMVATQLSTERQPVDDDDYVPASSKQLSSAVAELAKLVPDDQIKKFYLRVKDLAQDSVDEEQIPGDVRNSKMKENKSQQRAMLVRAINKILDESVLNEALPPPMTRAQLAAQAAAKMQAKGAQHRSAVEDDDDDDDEDFSNRAPKGRAEKEKKADFSSRLNPLEFTADPRKDREIASVTGHAAPSGARQYANVVLQKIIKDIIPLTNSEGFEDLVDFAQEEFVRLMQVVRAPDGQPRILPAEAADWISRRDLLQVSPVFQYFFNYGFYELPLSLWRNERKKRDRLDRIMYGSTSSGGLGFPKDGPGPKMAQTLFNMVWGFSAEDLNPPSRDKPQGGKLYKRIAELFPERADALYQEIKSRWTEFKEIASTGPSMKAGSDLIKDVKETWASSPEPDKINVLNRAIKSAQEDRAGTTKYI